MKKKIKDLKKNNGISLEKIPLYNSITFDEKVAYNGEALCTIDLKSITLGEMVIVLPN